MEMKTQQGPQSAQEQPVAIGIRFIVVGLVVPLVYQATFTTFAILAPETIFPPQVWLGFHLLTGVFFTCGPLFATGLPLRKAWRALGGRKVAPIDLALVVLIGTAATTALSAAYNAVMNTVFHLSASFGFTQSSQDVPLFVLFVVLVGPLGEEVLFRGYLGVLIRKRWVFILVSAAAWSAAHVDPYNALPLFWTGLMLAWVRQRTGSFYPTFALHFTINALALLLHYATPM
ncbi:MAG TPA: type II CAAX endopeptidase family protein [Ktedonobacteraceae bacterium]|nr:type II CAAX endopeptidase family protein [Ktedonobacteraceae bacterium]